MRCFVPTTSLETAIGVVGVHRSHQEFVNRCKHNEAQIGDELQRPGAYQTQRHGLCVTDIQVDVLAMQSILLIG